MKIETISQFNLGDIVKYGTIAGRVDEIQITYYSDNLPPLMKYRIGDIWLSEDRCILMTEKK
jgi:hypothetical protein